MTWLPKHKRTQGNHWPALRASILERDDHQCTVILTNGRRCQQPANAVDHIQPVRQGGSDHPANLRAICKWHHATKTGQEGAAGRDYTSNAKRPTEAHPSQR